MKTTKMNKFQTVSVIGFAIWAVAFIFHWLVGSMPSVSTLAVWFVFYFIGWLVAGVASHEIK